MAIKVVLLFGGHLRRHSSLSMSFLWTSGARLRRAWREVALSSYQKHPTQQHTCDMKLPMSEDFSAQATPEIWSHITLSSPRNSWPCAPPTRPPSPCLTPAPPLGTETPPERTCGGDSGGFDSSSPCSPRDSRNTSGYVIGIGRGVPTEKDEPEPTPEWWRTCRHPIAVGREADSLEERYAFVRTTL